MDMTMTMSMPTHTTMAMSPTSTGMNMGSMDGSMPMMMGMQNMIMAFFTSRTTPLYSTSWAPSTTGQYAGTCIFLIALAAIFRGFIALRCRLQGIYARAEKNVKVAKCACEASDEEEAMKKSVGSVQGRSWRVNEALVWASLDTCLAGVSYLLMLAVMTMNVGYFMSILGGTFLGSFVLGRWTGAAAH